MKFGCSFGIFLNSALLICRSTDISKCFSGSLRLRDNESRLYLSIYLSIYRSISQFICLIVLIIIIVSCFFSGKKYISTATGARESICLSIYLSFHFSVHQYIFLSIYIHPSIPLSRSRYDHCYCLACEAEARHMYCFSGGIVVLVVVGGVNFTFLCLGHFLGNYKG